VQTLPLPLPCHVQYRGVSSLLKEGCIQTKLVSAFAMSDLSEEECPSFLSPPSKRQRSPDTDNNDEDATVAQGARPVAEPAAGAAAVPTAGSAAALPTPGTGGAAFTWTQGLSEDEKVAVEKALSKVKRAKELAKTTRDAKKMGSGFRVCAHRKSASEKGAPRVDKGTFAGHRPPKNPDKLRFIGSQKDLNKDVRVWWGNLSSVCV
jgi:hypothetical protein